MKRLSILISLLWIGTVWANPSNSISIPNSFTPSTTISSSAVNANFNTIQSAFNTHTHTDISQLGAVTQGTWLANPIALNYGGTGQDFSTGVQGTILYFSALGTLSALPSGVSGSVLKTQGTGVTPIWEAQTPKSYAYGATTWNIANAGDQAITGIGFTPSAVIMIANIDTSVVVCSFGFSTGASATGGLTFPYSVGTTSESYLAYITISTGNAYCALKSFDGDGFTITWARTGNPTGTANLKFLCFK
jgi:hypothetical protein